jgi:cytochrome P450
VITRPDLLEIPLVASFAEADEILKSRDFRQDSRLEPAKAPSLPGILNLLHGQDHFQRRRVESPIFRRAALERYEEEILVPELRGALTGLVARRPPAGAVRAPDLPRLVRACLVRVSAAIIGLDLPDAAAVESLLEHSAAIAEGRDAVWAQTDQTATVERARAAWSATLDRFYAPSRRRRERLLADVEAGRRPGSDVPDDLISVLLRHPEALTGGDDLDLIAGELGLFLTASVNTTTAATPKAVESLSRWLEAHPEDRGLLADEGFLRRAAQEALRLYPTVPYLLREAETDVVLTTGRRFPGGGPVRIDIGAANRDPSVFGSTADRFDPHREAAIGRRYGLSFGGGIHMCIGLELTVGSQSGPEDERTTGTMVRVLRELYEAGLELDPDDPPRLRAGTAQHKYASFPVLFTRL